MIRNIFKKALTYLSVVEKEQKITFMVAVFMFLSEMRPFEPYRSAYLTGPDGNISLSEVIIIIISFICTKAIIHDFKLINLSKRRVLIKKKTNYLNKNCLLVFKRKSFKFKHFAFNGSLNECYVSRKVKHKTCMSVIGSSRFSNPF